MGKARLPACLFFFIYFSGLFGQSVGIGTSQFVPDASSILEIRSTDKGVLIPRVSLNSTSDILTIVSPIISLLVYNTNASMTNGGLGYWYWNGAKWVGLGPSWLL